MDDNKAMEMSQFRNIITIIEGKTNQNKVKIIE